MENLKQEIFEFEKLISKYSFVKKKEVQKGEILLTFLEKRNMIIILLEGAADLIRYDRNGYKTIIEHYSNDDLLSEMFYTISSNNDLFVEARDTCKFLVFFYEDVINRNSSTLITALLHIFKYKLLINNNRIEVLTKRSIREKLVSYFDMMTYRKLRKSFRLPFSYSDLADYLSIDRSAMMREIKNLIEDGIILKEGRKITKLN